MYFVSCERKREHSGRGRSCEQNVFEGVVVVLAVDFAVVGVVVVGKVAGNDIVVLGVDVVVLLTARVCACALVQGEPCHAQ